MAYNEEENIRQLLDSIRIQNLSRCAISDIVVISSGSIDRTNEIIKNYSRADFRIGLIVQSERRGKASAINLFLKNAKEQICILVNSDSILHADAIELLVRPFDNSSVGMTAGRPIPLCPASRFINHITRLLWDLHHGVSLRAPKMGELIAFRKDIVRQIIEDTAVDEVCVEWQIKNSGYKTVYVPESELSIRTPDTVNDFISQRRRIAVGHLWAEQVLRYTPATRNTGLVLQSILKHLIHNPRTAIFILAAVFLECLSRALGWYDYYIRRRNPYIWKVCLSTKRKQGQFVRLNSYE